MNDGAAALAGVAEVSRETLARLQTHVELVRRWQGAQNLVAAGTLDDIWRRHVADSAQLAKLFPEATTWIDLGSGAGFPGLVLAIIGAERGAGPVHLIESNRRKCAFLREAVRATDAPAEVHEGRVEDCVEAIGPVDRVAARALAPLPKLIGLARPALDRGAAAAFHKGRDFAREIAAATKSWDFDLVQHSSRITAGGVILDISNVRPKADMVNESVTP